MEMIQPPESLLKRWLPAILLMAIIFTLSSIPSVEMPSFGEFDFSVKKGGHILGYALLAQTYWWGLGRRDHKSAWLALIFTILYAASDELHQSFVPGRGATIYDVGIDAVGAFLSLLGPLFFWRR